MNSHDVDCYDESGPKNSINKMQLRKFFNLKVLGSSQLPLIPIIWLSWLCWLCCLCSSNVYAQNSLIDTYPNKPIKIIVPVAAGGNVDIVARAVANELTKSWGQSVIVENRPSAASLVGTIAVAHSLPDGYTLLASSSTFFSAAAILNNPGYDPIKDFTPVSLTCKVPMLMMAHPSVAVKNVMDVVNIARSHPGEISNASSGNGSTGHIASEVFASKAGIKFLNVFYKGNAQAMVDVIGGQANMIFDQISTAGLQYKSGKLNALAITSLKRSPLYPDIPTISESGYPGYEDVTLNFILAPAGTPKEITTKLNKEIQKILKQPEIISKFSDKGIELVSSQSTDEFGAVMKSEVDRLVKLVKSAGIKPE